MEETSDWRRAIGCSSVQIGRSCELQRSSALKGATASVVWTASGENKLRLVAG